MNIITKMLDINTCTKFNNGMFKQPSGGNAGGPTDLSYIYIFFWLFSVNIYQPENNFICSGTELRTLKICWNSNKSAVIKIPTTYLFSGI